MSPEKLWPALYRAPMPVLTERRCPSSQIADGSSLFAAGVAGVSGTFAASEAVRVLDASGAEVARSVCNYSACQAGLVAGKKSADYHSALGWHGPEEVIHRHNLVLIGDAGQEDDDEHA